MRGCKKINLGKMVDYKTLETALIKAAKDIGWTAKIEDESFKVGYKIGSGSVENVSDYQRTVVHLRGKLLPAAEVHLDNKYLPADTFYIFVEPVCFEFTSEKRVREYLGAVSRNLHVLSRNYFIRLV